MPIGEIELDYDNAVQEGWKRDQDGEISIDGYNAYIVIGTTDGTSGFQVTDSAGAVSFQAKSDGTSVITKNLGVGVTNPEHRVEVAGTVQAVGFKMPTGAVNGYILTSDSFGNASWKDAYVAGGGLSEVEHERLDQLVHDIAETSYDEVVRGPCRKITDYIIWTSAAKTTKIREQIISRDTKARPVSIITRQYNSTGTLVQEETEIIARNTSGKIISVTRTRTL